MLNWELMGKNCVNVFNIIVITEIWEFFLNGIEKNEKINRKFDCLLLLSSLVFVSSLMIVCRTALKSATKTSWFSFLSFDLYFSLQFFHVWKIRFSLNGSLVHFGLNVLFLSLCFLFTYHLITSQLDRCIDVGFCPQISNALAPPQPLILILSLTIAQSLRGFWRWVWWLPWAKAAHGPNETISGRRDDYTKGVSAGPSYFSSKGYRSSLDSQQFQFLFSLHRNTNLRRHFNFAALRICEGGKK